MRINIRVSLCPCINRSRILYSVFRQITQWVTHKIRRISISTDYLISHSSNRLFQGLLTFGCECTLAGEASDWHAAEAGSIPRCGKGFFPPSQLSVQTLLHVSLHPPCAIACINICSHVKDRVVHVRVRWIMETLKHLACSLGWVARFCWSWLSPGRATPISYGRNPNRTIQ